MASKPKFESLSVHRSSPPRTRSRCVPEPNSSPRTSSGCASESNSSPGTNGVPRTPFSANIVTPVETVKSVMLYDWWLTKGKGKGLGVGGFESKGGGGIRQFTSGAISKRHDSNTLETFDGITVTITDLINRSRSLHNGISIEVCNHFNFGFPFDWNEYNGDEEEGSVEKKDEAFDFDISFDDIPDNHLNDVLFMSSPHVRRKILDEVVDSLRGFAYPSTQESDKESEKSGMGDDDESLIPRVVGAKTRGMLRREEEEEDETSIGKGVHTASKNKKRDF